MNSPSIAYKQKKSILVGDSHCLSGLIPMLTITSPQELYKFFDAACVSKGVGDESLGKIDYLQFNQNIATATVVDTDQKKFSVSARWSTHNNRELKSIKTACHCPSAYNCRHGVALLLAVIKQKSISKNLTNKIIPPLKDRDISYYVSIVEKDFKKYFAVRIESTWFDSLSRIQQFKNVSLDELISSASYTDQSIGELLKMTCISLSSKYLLYHKEHIVKPTIKAIINTGRCYQIISKSKKTISHIDDIKTKSSALKNMNTKELEVKPSACIRLSRLLVENHHRDLINLGYIHRDPVEVFELFIDYDGTKVRPKTSAKYGRISANGKVYKRDLNFERRTIKQLESLGLVKISLSSRNKKCSYFVPTSSNRLRLLSVLEGTLNLLRREQYSITEDHAFRFYKTKEVTSLLAEIEDNGRFWFKMKLGIEVDGKQYSLLPILTRALSVLQGDYSEYSLESLNRDGFFYAFLPDNTQISIPFERIKRIISSIIDVFGKDSLNNTGAISISPVHYQLLKNRGLEQDVAFNGARRLKTKSASIEKLTSITPTNSPSKLKAKLRPYQKYGTGWLQEISAQRLGGILADDMGLGKTLQTLAHILISKQNNKLNNPALVICPRSVVDVWIEESKKFAPSLNVLNLTGKHRLRKFNNIQSFDLVITTYNLIHRDIDLFKQKRFFSIILDEAQNVKNPGTKAAKSLRLLKADHRLCLTGTPVENHLGELWAHFDFLLPGLLGDNKSFSKNFKSSSSADLGHKMAILKERIRPFVLRRLKKDVAQELPSKTTIIKRVSLAGQQRDLYETVRLSMNNEIKQEIESCGLAKSQIKALAALTKLRQVCCDPRLLAVNDNDKLDRGAKLNTLIDMIDELTKQDRKIIVFSQFTSMLSIIADTLKQNNIGFVKLTGQTKDRKTPVEQFQSGEAPVFLISLKAGGSGLTLTAADTVIHYDPWWNPQVEEQATDRAYRIGQDKPVFVYKLIAQGTLEEKILDMQESKRTLAKDVLDFEAKSSYSLSQKDLDSLFAPIS